MAIATDRPREELATIVSRYGREIVGDPRRCEGLLRDTCGACDREIFLLASVHKKHIPEELLALSPSVPKEILVRRLTGRIVQELGFAEEHALWAVVSWALALSALTQEDAKAMERKAGKDAGARESYHPVQRSLTLRIASSSRRQGMAISAPSLRLSLQQRPGPASSYARESTAKR